MPPARPLSPGLSPCPPLPPGLSPCPPLPPIIRCSAVFGERLVALEITAPDVHLLVALSGGCDSVVLLHLLRFGTGERSPQLSAAHFDHGMRPESEAGCGVGSGALRILARWSWLAAAHWNALLPRIDARRARYRFLRSAARTVGANWVVTAHHADDQAETVLLRILRGTGLRGLGGISGRVLRVAPSAAPLLAKRDRTLCPRYGPAVAGGREQPIL